MHKFPNLENWQNQTKSPTLKQLESTDGQSAKVDFNRSSSKSSYQDLPEERQKIKDFENSFPLFAVPTFLFIDLT
jgi:hypothetical protein